nr:hypothetical protein B0A51_08892 [Rachicladosporium sp. CCFEE 5018]
MSDPTVANPSGQDFIPRILPVPAPLRDAYNEAEACWDLKDEADAALADAQAKYDKALEEYEEAVRVWSEAHVEIEMREEREYVTMGEDIARWNARHWIPGLMQTEVTMWRAEVALRASVREVEDADQRVLELGRKFAWANESFERWYQPYLEAERWAQRGEERRAHELGMQNEPIEQREEEFEESAADREAAQREIDANWERYEREGPERERQLKEYLAKLKIALDQGKMSVDELEVSSGEEGEEMSGDEADEMSGDEAEEMSVDDEDEVRAREAEADRAHRAAVWEEFQEQSRRGKQAYEAAAARAKQEDRDKDAAFQAEFGATWEELQDRRAEAEKKARGDHQGGDPPSPPPPPPPPPPRDPGADARRREREARRANFAAGFYRANAGHQDTPVPVSDPVQRWYTYAQRALADYSQLTAFPAPPVTGRCSSMACASSGRSLQACECNVRAALDRLSVDQLSRVRRSFHPDRFSACAPALRAQFQQMAREIFVVANVLYRGRTRRPSVWQADPEKK